MNISKSRLFAVVFLFCILSSTIIGGVVYTYAAGTISHSVFEAGTQVETASYVVWVEGGTYYAKNGSTGAIEFSGTNASQIINNVMIEAGYPNSGGIVLLKVGVYELDAPLIVQTYVTLKGEGWSYPGSQFSPDVWGTVLKASHSVNVIESANISSWSETHVTCWGIAVRDLVILGEGVASNGVYFKGVIQSTIDNVFLNGLTGDGIVLDCLTQVVWVTNNRAMNIGGRAIVNLYADNWIMNNDVTSTGDCISLGNTTFSVKTNTVRGNLVRSSGGEGFYIRGSDNMITNNRADNCYTYGFFVAAGSRNTFTGNTAFLNGLNTSGTYAGFFDASHDSTYVGNTAYSTSQDRGFVFAGNGTAVSGNTATSGAIGFYVYCDWSTFSGNVARGNTGVGFQITSYGERNIVSGQISVDNSVDITDAGSNNQIHSSYNGTTWVT